MARAFYEPGPTANELAAFGFTAEDIGDQSVEIWPDNARSFELFVSLRTQWRIGMSGATGLDYNVLYHKLDRLNLTDDEYDEIERDVAIMEAEALDAIHAEK